MGGGEGMLEPFPSNLLIYKDYFLNSKYFCIDHMFFLVQKYARPQTESIWKYLWQGFVLAVLNL